MLAALIISQILSWLIILGLTAALIAVARQVGILHLRIAPVGALTALHGPAVGEAAPVLPVTALDGSLLTIGAPAPADRLRLLMFVSPQCPVCEQLIPAALSFARSEGLELLFVGDDAPAALAPLLARNGIAAGSFVNSPTVGREFHVDKLPYAVLLGGDGKILSKGLVNSREHLESLIVSHELGVASVQDYLGGLGTKQRALAETAGR